MRTFLQAFDSGLGATTTLHPDLGSNYNYNGTEGSSFAMKSIEVRSGRDTTMTRAMPASIFRPDVVRQVLSTSLATVTGTGGENGMASNSRKSTESTSSKRAIINKTVEWDVRYEETEAAS